MSILTTLLIAIGLAMDCFAVSISAGSAVKKKSLGLMLKIAFLFGTFQAGMTLIGFYFGLAFETLINDFDHWIAFFLLLFVGGKMVYEAVKNGAEEKTDYSSNRMLLILSVATSIDALAVGISFAFLDVSCCFSVLMIGLMSFLFSIIGVMIGKNASKLLGNKAEIIGGVILILIGLKILLEHLGILS